MSHSPGVTFRGNTFRNCGVFDISLGRGDWWGQPQYGNVTIENNLFGHTVDGGAAGDWHYYGLAWWLETLNGARVVNNTFENAVSMDRANGGTGGVWANNIGGGWTCEPGVTYVGNVGKACSGQDKAVNPSGSSFNQTAPMGWVNPAAFDFNLMPNSRAVDAGSAQFAPTHDRTGTPRSGAPRRRRIRIRLGASAHPARHPRPPTGPASHPVGASATGHHLPARASRVPAECRAARRDVAEGPCVGTADPAALQSPSARRPDAHHARSPPFSWSREGTRSRARAVPTSDHRRCRRVALEGRNPLAPRSLTRSEALRS